MIDPAGLAIIRLFEGCHKPDGPDHVVAYLCPANVWTIGWGTTGPGIKKGLRISRATADMLLDKDIARFAAGVLRASPALIVHPVAFSAVVSFAYNLGVGAYQASTLRRHIDHGRWADAAAQFPRWVNAGGRRLAGLVRRRAAEQTLFMQGIR